MSFRTRVRLSSPPPKKQKVSKGTLFVFFRLNGSDGRRTLVPEKQGVSEANGLFRCGLYARIDSRRLHHVGMDSSSIPIFFVKNRHIRRHSSFSQKGTLRIGYSLASALITPLAPLPPFCGCQTSSRRLCGSFFSVFPFAGRQGWRPLHLHSPRLCTVGADDEHPPAYFSHHLRPCN